MQRLKFLIAAFAAMSLVGTFASAQSRLPGAEVRAKANEWTVGLAAGLPEDAYLPIAAEIARNLNQSGNLRVLPLATPGAADNIKDLLFLTGIDIALTQTDVLHYLRTVEKIPQVEKRVHFVTALGTSDVHLLARAEIKSVRDLAGKRVGFNVQGAGPTITAPIIFDTLGVRVEPVYVSTTEAIQMMRSGELSALVHTAAKPSPVLAGLGQDQGFRLLPIPFDPLDKLYLPGEFSSKDYPRLIGPGQSVETVSVQSVLAVLDRPATNDRARRVRRFVDTFFERFDRFKGPGYQIAWRDVNLAADVPGWIRYEPAAERLRQEVAKLRKGAPASSSAVMAPAEQERLFQRFLTWYRQQKG